MLAGIICLQSLLRRLLSCLFQLLVIPDIPKVMVASLLSPSSHTWSSLDLLICTFPLPFFVRIPVIGFRAHPNWLRRESICLQCGRPGFNSWVGKIPWRSKWQSTPALLPGKSHGRRSLIGYSPWGCKVSDMTSLSLTCYWRKISEQKEITALRYSHSY